MKTQNLIDTARQAAKAYENPALQILLTMLADRLEQLEEGNAELNNRIYEHNCRLIGAPKPPKE